MDFIMCLPKRKKQNYYIFVLVDKFSKVAHFIPLELTYKVVYIVDIFLNEIVILHEIPKEIISDRDTKFTENFWTSLFFVLEI